MVEWKSLPHALQEDTVVFGCGSDPLEEGTVVVEGVPYLYLDGNPHWFQRPKTMQGKTQPKKELFWIQYVVMGKIGVTHGQHNRNMPTQNTTAISDFNRAQPMGLIHVSDQMFEIIQKEIKARAQLDLIGWVEEQEPEQVAQKVEAAAEEESEEEYESEDESDNESDGEYLPRSRNSYITPMKRTRSSR